jgi:hypothetical protein
VKVTSFIGRIEKEGIGLQFLMSHKENIIPRSELVLVPKPTTTFLVLKINPILSKPVLSLFSLLVAPFIL